MAKGYVNEGINMTYTNGGAAIKSGDVVVIGGQLAVALVDIATGATGACALGGVFDLPKVDAAVIAQGEALIYDVSAAKFDDGTALPAVGDASNCCIAMEAKGATAGDTIKVKINVGVCTIT